MRTWTLTISRGILGVYLLSGGMMVWGTVYDNDGRVAGECGGGGKVGRMRGQTRWAGRRASRGQFME